MNSLEMKKYILLDIYGEYQVVEANHRPAGTVCEAPQEAGGGDGDLIDLVDGVASINQERKAAKETARAQVAIDRKWLNMRNARNALLAGSDWTQLAGSPLSDQKKTDWQAYRQSLRDLPDSIEDINNVIWPVKPE